MSHSAELLQKTDLSSTMSSPTFTPCEGALQGDCWLHCVFMRNLSSRNHRPGLIRAPGCGLRPLLRRGWNAWQSWRTRSGPQPGPRGRRVQTSDPPRGRIGATLMFGLHAAPEQRSICGQEDPEESGRLPLMLSFLSPRD